MPSAEIVATALHVERVRDRARRRHARLAQRRGHGLRFDESGQDRQREILMVPLDRLIEPVRQLAVARQRAVPFAAVIGDAADLPLRQFEIDQRQRCFCKSFGINQAFDPRRLCALSE